MTTPTDPQPTELTRDTFKAQLLIYGECYIDDRDMSAAQDALLDHDAALRAQHEQDQARIKELKEQHHILCLSQALAGVVADPLDRSYIQKRSEILHGDDVPEWFAQATKESIHHEMCCALLNWSFNQDEVKKLRQQVNDLTAQLAQVTRERDGLQRDVKNAIAMKNAEVESWVKARSLEDAAEYLWSVVANVSEGDWTKQSNVWQEAAAKARDEYFAAIEPTQRKVSP